MCTDLLNILQSKWENIQKRIKIRLHIDEYKMCCNVYNGIHTTYIYNTVCGIYTGPCIL